ncbi:MAG: hypothetical protein ACHQ6T_12170 [Myxococcota bacterium]
MERRSVQYCLRLPEPLYRDAVDVALVFDLSLNRFIAAAVERYVSAQLRQPSLMVAIERIREARRAGLASPPNDAPAQPENREVSRESS